MNKNIKVCLDSRLIKPGDYFVPVVGENFDGHKFIDQVLEKGASGIIEEKELYEISTNKLNRINPIVIAVTGSVGKSTTVNFLNILLSEKFSVCVGTLNTKLGLATNIVNDMNDDCEIFLAECGMDRPGELFDTGEFIKPDVVMITNISESHIEKLGSLEEIKKAKMELTQNIKQHGRVFLNWENKNIQDAEKYIPENLQIVHYGNIEHSEFTNQSLEKFLGKKIQDIKFKFIGIHNYLNVLGASIVAIELGVNKEKLLLGLEKLETPKGRLKIIDGINDSILIDDTYNSSPVSCVSAIESTIKFFEDKNLSGRKIAVLGGMLELGVFEDEGHKLVGEALEKQNFDEIILVGELAKKIIISNPKIHYCENSELASNYILEKIKPNFGDVILIKGSQGIRMEKVTKALMKNTLDAEKLLVRQDTRWK